MGPLVTLMLVDATNIILDILQVVGARVKQRHKERLGAQPLNSHHLFQSMQEYLHVLTQLLGVLLATTKEKKTRAGGLAFGLPLVRHHNDRDVVVVVVGVGLQLLDQAVDQMLCGTNDGYAGALRHPLLRCHNDLLFHDTLCPCSGPSSSEGP